MTFDSAKIELELDHIVDMVNLMDDTLKFHINMQYTLILGIFAIVGTALYFLAKIWFENITKKRIDAKFEKLKEEQKSSLNHLEDQIKARQWYRPTIINGYTTIEDEILAISKNSISNTVYFRGALKHSGTLDNIAFGLSKGYRPLQKTTFNLVTGEQRKPILATLIIYPDGKVVLNAPRDEVVYVNGISFFAEQ